MSRESRQDKDEGRTQMSNSLDEVTPPLPTSPGVAAPTDQPTVGPGLVVSYRSRRSRLGHLALLAGGWLLFAWLWWRLLQRPQTMEEIASASLLLLLLAVTVATLTWAWVAHNLALARRRGGRRNGVPPRVLPSEDALGRRLVMDADASTAPQVAVLVNRSAKLFLTGDVSGDV